MERYFFSLPPIDFNMRLLKKRKKENDNLITGQWSAANVAPRTNKKPQDLVTCLNEQHQIW